MVVVDSQGGLANRMQAIDSAWSLARDLGHELCIPWNVNEACGARADQLFDATDAIGRFLYFTADEDIERYIASQPSAVIIDHTVPPFTEIPNADMVSSLGAVRASKDTTIIIRSWARFYPTAVPFRVFSPMQILRDRVAQVTAGFHQTVGVHIRRTDHRDSTSASPTSAFIGMMKEALESGEALDFFLATDDPSEQDALKRHFSVIAYSKRSQDRRRAEAIQDALVDLYCLGLTSRIIGSAGSTFSLVASELSGIRLTIAR
jgi:hypothetical protein